MIYAQIKDGFIENTLVLDDSSLLSLYQINLITNEVYDYVLQIDQLYPRPGIGWQFDGILFIAPTPIPDPDEEESP